MRTGAIASRLLLWIVLLSGTVGALPAHADDNVDPRVEQEIEETLLRLIDMGALDDKLRLRPLVVKRPPRIRYELGAVVDISAGQRSFPVVAITPGGSADRMGLKVGDRVSRINDVVLATSFNPQRDFAREIHNDRGSVRLKIIRDGQVMQLSGSVEAIEVPGFELRVDRTALRRVNKWEPFSSDLRDN